MGNVSVSKTVFHLRIDVSMKIQCETLNNPRKIYPSKIFFTIYITIIMIHVLYQESNVVNPYILCHKNLKQSKSASIGRSCTDEHLKKNSAVRSWVL